MKISSKVVGLFFGLVALFATARGQGFDAGKVSVIVGGQAIASTTFEEGSGQAIFQLNFPEVPAGDINVSVYGITNTPGEQLNVSSGVMKLIPGRSYEIVAWTSYIEQWKATATAPPGYVVEFDGVEAAEWPAAKWIRIVPQREAFSGRAGTSTSIATGRVHWQASLGNLANGDSARCLSILDVARGATWSDVFSPRGLSVQSNEVSLVRDPVTLEPRQVAATETVVDIIVTSSTSYDLKFYASSAATAPPFGATLWTFGTNQPFVVYSISREGSDTCLKIVRTDNSSTGSAIRVSQTILERTGTSAQNFVWTLKDWHDANQTVVPVTEITTWAPDPVDATVRLETIVKKNDAGVVASTVKKRFKAMPWGEELISTTRGTSDAITETLTYHVPTVQQQNSQIPLAIRSKQSGGENQTTGRSWEAYSYSLSSGRTGKLKRTFRPYNGVPANPPDIAVEDPNAWSTTSGEVTTVTYGNDPFGRVADRVTLINNVQVSRSQTSFLEMATPKGAPYVKSTKTDWNTNTPGVATSTTITKYFREDLPVHMMRNQIWSVENPDGTKHAFTYQFGSFNGTSFDRSVANGAVRTSAIKGRIQGGGGTKLTALLLPGESAIPSATYTTAGELDDVYVIDGRSVLEATIRDEAGRIRRTESYVWSGGVWNPTGFTTYQYDYANRLISRTSSNGGVYTASFQTIAGAQAALLQWEEDETGVRTDYTYDKAGRVETATKKGVAGTMGDLKTTFVYDADGHVISQAVSAAAVSGQPVPPAEQMVTTRTYDDSGRMKTETPPGRGVTTTTYNYDPLNRAQTVILPSGATRVETYGIDGRLASVTGTAVVPEYYTYSIQSGTGYRVTQTNFGTPNNVRKSESWTDQMGRVVHKSRPGFTGQVDFVEGFSFSPTTGQLMSQSRTGFAPTLFEYDTMGRVSRTGIDLGGIAGTLDLVGIDRIIDTDEFYESFGGNWWLTTVQSAYFANDSPISKVVSRSQKRLTGFTGNLREEIRTRDAEGESAGTTEDKDVVRTVNYNSTTKALTATTSRPGHEFPQVETSYAGLAVSSLSHAGLTVTTTYDHLWRAATVTDQRTGAVNFTYYGGTALLKTREDATKTATAAGNITTYEYDNMGRTILARDPAGYDTRSDYNLRGQLLRQWGNGAYPILYGYDTLGQRETMTTYQTGAVWSSATWPLSPPSGNGTMWVYDAPSGLLAAKKDANNVTTSYTYNARGQVHEIKSPRLNEAGAPITITHAYHGGTGELTGKTYNDGTAALSYADRTPSLNYTYTRTGQVDAVEQGQGTTTAITHDLIYDPTSPWRLSTENWGSFFGGRLFTHTFETTSAIGSVGGYGTHKVATVRGRLNGFQIGVAGSALNLAQDRHETVTYSNLGRVAAVTTRAGSDSSRNFVYAYTANSSLLAGYTSGGFTQSIQYEAKRDLVSAVVNSWTNGPTAAIAQYDYVNDSVGRRYGIKQSSNLNSAAGTLGAFADLGGSLFHRFVYNGRGEMESGAAYLIEQPIGIEESPAPYASSQLPERNFFYAYDHAGNRLSAGRNGPFGTLESYLPNNLNQYSSKQYHAKTIAGTSNTGATVAVSGASVPPIVSRRGRYWAATAFLPNVSAAGAASLTATASVSGGGSESASRLATIGATAQAFVYDLAGNLIDDGIWDYKWDAENRLVSMKTKPTAVAQGFPNQLLEFRYDHLGRRIQKRVQTVVSGGASTDVYRRYLYDGWNLVAEFAATAASCGDLVRSFAWGLDVTGSFTASGGVGALLYLVDRTIPAQTKTAFAARDANGNVVALLDPSTNAVAAAYEYSPFGEILRADGPLAAANPFRFSSKFTDDESGLVYYGHRYFSPELGRFINRDPIEEEGGANLYGFCGNNGVSGWDYLGMNNPSQPPNGQPNQGEPVKLDAFVVTTNKAGDGPGLFFIGVYGASRGFGATSSIATLTDNRSFTRQVEDIVAIARIKEALQKSKKKISFERLRLCVALGIDPDQLHRYMRDMVRARFDAIKRMSSIGLFDFQGELGEFAPALGRGIWNSIKGIKDLHRAAYALIGFQVAYARIKNHYGPEEAEAFRETYYHRIAYGALESLLTPRGRAEGIYGAISVPLFLKGAQMMRSTAASFAEGLGSEGATLRLPASMADELLSYQNAADDGFLVKTRSSDLPRSKARSIWEKENGPVPDGFDVDHIIQRQFGGLDELSNLQLKPSSLNRSQGSRAMWLNKAHPYGTVFKNVELMGSP